MVVQESRLAECWLGVMYPRFNDVHICGGFEAGPRVAENGYSSGGVQRHMDHHTNVCIVDPLILDFTISYLKVWTLV